MVAFNFELDSVKDQLNFYASVFIKGNFLIVGGRVDGAESNTIARLDATWAWSKAGRLNTARLGHGAIWVNSKLVVVGGEDKYLLRTEYCDLVNDEYICTDQDSSLPDYSSFPLLFAVTDDYGNCSAST